MDQTTPEDPGVPVLVAVTRTGGFAGLRREWRVEPPVEEASEWVALIAQCPWDAAARPSTPTGADRFVWFIRARCAPDEEQQAALADEQVTGAWRELVDAVRDRADDRRASTDGTPRLGGSADRHPA